MLGQAHVEQRFVQELKTMNINVDYHCQVMSLVALPESVKVAIKCGDSANVDEIHARYVIGADGAHSLVRKHFDIPFAITSPQLIWAVIDGEIETDFQKEPSIVVFQQSTADVAWIPREDNLDRFYVRMDRHEFKMEEAIQLIQDAIQPFHFRFKTVDWFSQFEVREGVAEHFEMNKRVFLAGDACHTHSVNGGQGLNTGLADAFNLVWKLYYDSRLDSCSLIETYEQERKPVAHSVIESSGKLVRSTKYRSNEEMEDHAHEYLSFVEQYSGNVTGMGIRYQSRGIAVSGCRLLDFQTDQGRFYSTATFDGNFHLIVFDGDQKLLDDIDFFFDGTKCKEFVKLWLLTSDSSISVNCSLPNSKLVVDQEIGNELEFYHYGRMILVRPDMYILNQSDSVELLRADFESFLNGKAGE